MISTTPTHYQAYNGQNSQISERFSWMKTAYSTRNGATTKTEEQFLCPFEKREKRVRQCQPRPFHSQPRQPACHDYVHPPTYPHPTFFASAKPYLQNGLLQLITCSQSCMMSRPIIQWSKEILVNKQDAICRNTARAEGFNGSRTMVAMTQFYQCKCTHALYMGYYHYLVPWLYIGSAR